MNVYFDNNTIPDLARTGVDPISALAGSRYVPAVTPDLATEYRQAIANELVPSHEKELCRRLLSAATPRGIFGFAEGGGGYSGFGCAVLATDGMVKTIQSITITAKPNREIPKNRTDAFLAALAAGAVIITNDGGSHFKRARAAGQHVFSWAELALVEEARSDIARDLARLLFPQRDEASELAAGKLTRTRPIGKVS